MDYTIKTFSYNLQLYLKGFTKEQAQAISNVLLDKIMAVALKRKKKNLLWFLDTMTLLTLEVVSSMKTG